MVQQEKRLPVVVALVELFDLDPQQWRQLVAVNRPVMVMSHMFVYNNNKMDVAVVVFAVDDEMRLLLDLI